MASTAEICGFEGGDETGCTGLGGETITSAATRTGNYGCRISAVASTLYGIQVGQGLAGFASQTHHGGFCQFMFRLGGPPSVNNSMFCGFQDVMWLSCGTTGLLTLHCAGIGSTHPASFAINVLDTTTWYKCAMSIYAPTDGSGNRVCVCVISQYVGSTLTYIVSASLSAVNIGFTAMPPFTLGGLTGNGAASTTWQWDVDDCIYAAASGADFDSLSGLAGLGFALTAHSQWGSPTTPMGYDQIWPITMAAQGTHNDFAPAGRFDLIDEIPKGAGQISSAVGWTNYVNSHISGAANATVVEAWTFRVNATAAPQKSHYLTASASGIDTLFALTIGASSAGSNASSLMASTFYPPSLVGTLEPVGTFNNTQFGVENNDNTSTITIQNMYVEVLAGTPVPQIPALNPIADVMFSTTLPTFTTVEGKGIAITVTNQWQIQRLDTRLDIEEDL